MFHPDSAWLQFSVKKDEITVQINELKKQKIESLNIKCTHKKFLKAETEQAISNGQVSQNHNIGSGGTAIPLVTTSYPTK